MISRKIYKISKISKEISRFPAGFPDFLRDFKISFEISYEISGSGGPLALAYNLLSVAKATEAGKMVKFGETQGDSGQLVRCPVFQTAVPN